MDISDLFRETKKLGASRAYIQVHPYVLAALMLDEWFVANFLRAPQELMDRFSLVGMVEGVDVFVRP